MKKTIALLVALSVVLVLCACGTDNVGEVVAEVAETEEPCLQGNKYICSSLEIVDPNFKDVSMANTTFATVISNKSDAYIIVDDNHENIEYVNFYGKYTASIILQDSKSNEYDCIVEWDEIPTVIEGHETTATTLVYLPSGVVRLYFSLDGNPAAKDIYSDRTAQYTIYGEYLIALGD